MNTDRAIKVWLAYVDLKVTDIYSNYDVRPVMPFYKFKVNELDHDQTVFIDTIKKGIFSKSKGKLNWLHNKDAVKIDATSSGQHGIFFITLYDGYYFLSLTISGHPNYTT